jgi:hypothetical protein
METTSSTLRKLDRHTHQMRRGAVATTVLALILGLSGCGGDNDKSSPRAQSAAAPPQVLKVTADKDSWETAGTTSVKAGWVSIRFRTLDQGQHGLALFGLAPDVTMGRFVRFLRTPKAQDFDKVLELGTPLGASSARPDPRRTRWPSA